jgi:hypothetical protein
MGVLFPAAFSHIYVADMVPGEHPLRHLFSYSDHAWIFSN